LGQAGQVSQPSQPDQPAPQANQPATSPAISTAGWARPASQLPSLHPAHLPENLFCFTEISAKNNQKSPKSRDLFAEFQTIFSFFFEYF